MKILFVCHRFPFPPNRGGKIRPFNMIRHLNGNHEVTVGSLAHSEQELEEGSGLKQYCSKIIAEVVPEKLRWIQAARALFSTKPSSVAYFWSRKLLRRIEEAARKPVFDAVIVHCAFAAQYALTIPAVFRVMDFGDLDSGKWLEYAKWKPFPAGLAYRLEACKLQQYEKAVAQKFDYCTLTTEGELDEFKKLEVDRSHTVIPNGVDSNYFQPSSRNGEKKKTIIFLGRMDYFPNIDGIVYFAKTILPTIRARIPDAQLRIIGSDPSSEVKKLGEIPGIVLTGHVPDVRPYLRDAAVSIAPLRMARGTQNKILESMAMGIPVVATPQAAKGVQGIPGKHLLVGDNDESFAHQLIRILETPTLRECLSNAGRKRVEAAHAWTVSMTLLDKVLGNAESTRNGLPKQVCHR